MKTRKQYHGKPGGKILNLIRQYFPKVNDVIDANQKAIVEVIKTDVTQAKVKDPALCAFARACYRSFSADGVIIGLTTSYIIKGKTAVRYHNAETISREVISFDRRAGFDTGRYLLSPFSPQSRLGVYHEQPAHPKNGGKDRRQFRHYTKGVRVLSQSEEVRS